MQGYDVNRASKAKTAKDLGDSEPGGCEWGSVRATASEAVKGTVQRWLEVVETFQGLGAWPRRGLLARGVEGRLSASPLHCILKTHL